MSMHTCMFGHASTCIIGLLIDRRALMKFDPVNLDAPVLYATLIDDESAFTTHIQLRS